MFTVYNAKITVNAGNCSYPNKQVITDENTLKAAVCHDYVCAEYRNHYRCVENFIGSDCLPMDCDNDHTEDPAGWKTPEDIQEAFPGVTFAVHYSRHNEREKDGKPPRPKFHVLFPIDYVSDPGAYTFMKQQVNARFPYFDPNALDAARFFFGTESAEVAIYQGERNLSDYLEETGMGTKASSGPDAKAGDALHSPGTAWQRGRILYRRIQEGQRNTVMHSFAVRILKR